MPDDAPAPAPDRPPGDADRIELFPIDIGEYASWDRLEVRDEVEAVATLLREFSVEPVLWDDVEMGDRDRDAAWKRLKAWRGRANPSFLYWVGHGWTDGSNAALACADSDRTVGEGGISTAALAEVIRGRVQPWSVVIIDGCRSARFVERLNSQLFAPGSSVSGLMLLGTSAEGTTYLGNFSAALGAALETGFPNRGEVPVAGLFTEVKRRLRTVGVRLDLDLDPDLFLRRARPVPVGVTLEDQQTLEDALAQLPSDEAAHFVEKARGAELDEAAWYFQGREKEAAEIAAWLRTDDPMLVVTGPPGAGKSALLGYVFVNSWPAVREALATVFPEREAAERERPPDHAFDATINLTGMRTGDVVDRLGEVVGWSPPAPDSTHPQRMEALREAAASGERRTVMVDGLDECQQAFAVAGVLRDLAATGSLRLVVGTRWSTFDDPDQRPEKDTRLLDAVCGEGVTVVPVERDAAAVAGFVRNRLERAEVGTPDQVEHLVESLEHALGETALSSKGFLFGSLLVHELLADRTLLDRPAELERMLAGSHRDLFATAVHRLGEKSPVYGALLEALGFALGRGMPDLDGVIRSVAARLGGMPEPDDEEIRAFRSDAARYVVTDAERGQTVYRLAHRTFQDYYVSEGAGATAAERNEAIVEALIDAADRREDPRRVNPYVERYLSGHAALAGSGGWERLGERTDVLDLLEPAAVAGDALRTPLPTRALPDSIVAVIASRHLMAASDVADREGLRQLGLARATGDTSFPPARDAGVDPTWRIRSAVLRQQPVHTTLEAPADVRALTTFEAGEVPLVAAACGDGRVQLWSAADGDAIAPPMRTGLECAWSVCCFTGTHGGPVVAVGGDRGAIELWDPALNERVGRRSTGEDGPVRALVSYSGARGVEIAAAGDEGVIRIFDPASGQGPVRELPDAGSPIRALAVIGTGPEARIVGGGNDGFVRIWPAAGGAHGAPLRGPTDWVHALCTYSDSRFEGAPERVAASSHDTNAYQWKPPTPFPVQLAGHSDAVRAIAAFAHDGDPRLATGGSDGTVRIWDPNPVDADPEDGLQVGGALTGHSGAVTAMTGYSWSGAPRVVSGGEDGTVRVWDPSAADAADEGDMPRAAVAAVAVIGSGEDAQVATAGGDAVVRIWDLGVPATPTEWDSRHDGAIRAIVPLDGSPGVLATCGVDELVRFLDTLTGAEAREPLRGHTRAVRAFASYAVPGGERRFVTGGEDGTVRLWDARAGVEIEGARFSRPGSWIRDLAIVTVARTPLIAVVGHGRDVVLLDGTSGAELSSLPGHSNWPMAACVFADSRGAPRLATAGDDGTVRLWDVILRGPSAEPLRAHDGPIGSLTTIVTGAGPRLVSGGHDGTVCIWDPGASGEPRRVRLGTRVNHLAGTGRTVVVGTDDGHLVLDVLQGA